MHIFLWWIVINLDLVACFPPKRSPGWVFKLDFGPYTRLFILANVSLHTILSALHSLKIGYHKSLKRQLTKMYLLDLLLVTVLSWPVYPGETDQEYTCIIILLWEKASIFIHIPHQARTLLMASITSSSHRWVRSIGHSQSCYHLKPFIPLHSPSFLDILSVPCPLSVSSNPSQSHIDLHDTLPDVLFFSFQTHPTHAHHTHHKHPHSTTYWHIHSTFSSITFLLYTHTHTYIQPHNHNTWASLILPESSLEPLSIWWLLLVLSFYQDLHDAGSVLR